MKQTVKNGHLVMQRADQLPQLRHCAVMFSAPLRLLVKSWEPKVRQKAILSGCDGREEE